MKIITENLKSLSKIWSMMRKQGMRVYEYVYIDFDNRKIKFIDEQTLVIVDLALVNYSAHEPMYVEGSKFFSLVGAYDAIEVKDDDLTFYTSDGNKFTLPQIDVADASFPDDDYNDWNVQKIDFSEEFNKIISSSLNYVDSDINSEFSTLYFVSGYAVALDQYKMFFAKLPASFTGEFNFPYQFIKIITALKLEGTIDFNFRLLSNEAVMVEFTYNGIRIRFSSSAKYQLPVDPLDPDFQKQFNHDNYFIVNKNQLNSSVNFLGEFLKDVTDVICTCKFVSVDDSDNPLDEPYLRIDSNYSGEVSYKIPIKEFSDAVYFNDKTLVLYLNIFRSVISTLSNYNTEDILVRYEDGQPAVYFANADNTRTGISDDVYVIHTVIQE